MSALACSEATPAPPPATVVSAAAGRPAALEAAHEAYLRGEWVIVGERVRDVIAAPSTSAPARDNAWELLDAAYRETAAHLPAGFALPAGVDSLTYGHVNGMSPGGPFARVYLRGEGDAASHVRELSITRGAEIVLDRLGGVGKFDTPRVQKGVDFRLERSLSALPGDGVYGLHLALDDGRVLDTFFLVHALSSSTTPTVLAPANAEAVSDTTPRVRWSPFRSPEHVSFEARTLSVYVSRDLGGGREATAWDFFTTAPAELGELSVGGTLGEGKSPLEAGDHWLALTAGEQRFFGPLRLVRASRTVQSFHVVP